MAQFFIKRPIFAWVISLFILVLIALGVIALGYWLLIASEGVYLGRRAVIWL